MENEKETGCKIFLPTLNSSKKKKKGQKIIQGTLILGKKKLPQIKLKPVYIRITSVNYLITVSKYFLESC